MKKKIKSLNTSFIGRSLSLTMLGLQAGTKAAIHKASTILSDEQKKSLKKKTHLVEQMALLSKELGNLKGSLMKAGQMLSVYGEHFLPPEANVILKSLQSDAAQMEWKEIRKILIRQLGKEKLNELEIEQDASAAASLAQVHRAKWIKNQQDLVLKIQYPGVDHAIEGDIKAIRKLLNIMNWLPKIPSTEDLFLEIREMLKNELNYDREVKMLNFFRDQLKNENNFVLPKPIPEFCTKKIIAMSFESGLPVDSEYILELSQDRRNAISQSILDLYFRELFVWRKVQTDPHFGNYRIRLGNPDQILLYDYGAVREFDKVFVEKYKSMLRGIFFHNRNEFEEAAQLLGVLHFDDPTELKDLFYELCSLIIEPFKQNKVYFWKNTQLPQKVTKLTWEIIRRFPLRAPPRELVFLDRKMAGVFTFLSVLDAKINAREVLGKYL